MARKALSCIMPLLVLCALLTVAPASAELEISGYTQARYWDDDADKDVSTNDYDFDVKRLYLKLAGPINDDGTKFTLQVDLGGLDDDKDLKIQDAKITHPLNDAWTAQFGYADMPFGCDVVYSSSKRLPFERAAVTRALFPGEKATGLHLFYKPQANSRTRPHFLFGFSDDLEDMKDKLYKAPDTHEDSKALVMGVRWLLPNKGEAGISYMSADREGFDAANRKLNYDNDVLGFHVRHNGSRGFSVQAEYFDGERGPADVSGWYATLEYAPPQSKTSWFYRYDVYDDGDPDDYQRHTIGAAWEPGKNSRVTVQYQDIDDEGTTGSDVGVQWLVKY